MKKFMKKLGMTMAFLAILATLSMEFIEPVTRLEQFLFPALQVLFIVIMFVFIIEASDA